MQTNSDIALVSVIVRPSWSNGKTNVILVRTTLWTKRGFPVWLASQKHEHNVLLILIFLVTYISDHLTQKESLVRSFSHSGNFLWRGTIGKEKRSLLWFSVYHSGLLCHFWIRPRVTADQQLYPDFACQGYQLHLLPIWASFMGFDPLGCRTDDGQCKTCPYNGNHIQLVIFIFGRDVMITGG